MKIPVFLSIAMVTALLLVAPVAAKAPWPARIDLPDNFRPEGIAIGSGNEFFVGSIPTGDIYRGDVRTGEGEVFIDAPAGRAAIGLSYDRGYLWVAGGPTGDAYVYDARTGQEVAAYNFTDSADTFINDVVATNDAAYFTDSRDAVIYVVSIERGRPSDTFETLALTGDLVVTPGVNNLNGIDATPNGKTLVAVQSNTGKLFLIDPETGATTEIDLGGESVPNGDGILLDGRTLYVLQNQLNLVAKIELSRDLTSGVVVSRTGNADFSVPTTIAEKGNTLYAVNARFGVPGANTFWVTAFPKP